MKSFKILISALAVSAAVFSACTAEKDVFTGIDKNKAKVTEFAYDETMSSETGISLIWNPAAAIKDGATSFSVQLAREEDFSDATMYQPSVSFPNSVKGQTIMADAPVNDGVMFAGLKEYDRFFARVRANYPRSIYSEWTVLSDADGIVCISVGHGLVSMSFTAPKALTLNSPSYNKIVAVWSIIGNAEGYAVEYKESSASAWTIIGETDKASAEINGLNALTAYDVRVKAFRTVDGNKEFTDYTTASVTTPAKPDFEPAIKTKDQVLRFFQDIASTAGATDSYTLENDVDMEGATISIAASFGGIFDGKNHKIQNAIIPDGLFSEVSGTIKDIKFEKIQLGNSLAASVKEGATISGISVDATSTVSFPEPSTSAYFGTIAGTNAGTVENCSTAANCELQFAALPGLDSRTPSEEPYCSWGGIVGHTTGLVKGCSNAGAFSLSVTAPTKSTDHAFGGVVGSFNGAPDAVIIENCSNTGNVSVEFKTAVYFYVGGVVGSSLQTAGTTRNCGIIKGCTNEGNVSMHYIDGGSGAYPNVGGIVGYAEGYVQSCTNKGKISILCDSASATWTCARVAGVGGTVSIGADDCHNEGQLSATALFAGGTAGARGAGNIATSCFGGVIGSAGPYTSDGSNKFQNCTNKANITLDLGTITETPNHHCGGLFGYVTGTISNCQNTGNITVNCPTAINRLGGIAGGCIYNVDNCVNTGDLKVTHAAVTKDGWRHFIGGIIADSSKASSACTYTKCSNSGAINLTSTATVTTGKTSCLGGIVGGGTSTLGETFTDCTNTGAITYSSPGATTTGDMIGGAYN